MDRRDFLTGVVTTAAAAAMPAPDVRTKWYLHEPPPVYEHTEVSLGYTIIRVPMPPAQWREYGPGINNLIGVIDDEP